MKLSEFIETWDISPTLLSKKTGIPRPTMYLKLSKRNNYEFTKEEAQKISAAIEQMWVDWKKTTPSIVLMK